MEGPDASGKSTQYGAIVNRLDSAGRDYKCMKFPCYDDPSSLFVRMYLSGELGLSPGDVNAYAASSFFAVDRFVSYKKNWGDYYENGGTLFCDRYVTSNAIHQGAKIDESGRNEYFKWLYEYEFDKLCLPKPDLVLFLDVSPEVSAKNMDTRDETRDIHEKDNDYLRKCSICAREAAQYYGWTRVVCEKDGRMLPREQITDELYKKIIDVIGE